MYKSSSVRLGQRMTRVLRWTSSIGCLVAAVALSACAVPVTRVTRVYEAPQSAPPLPQAFYGTVSRIEVTDVRQEISGGGALLGGLIGGIIGNQVGHGFGRAAATAAGAVGGAVVGNGIEHREAEANSGTHYRVTVQLDDSGGIRRFDYEVLGRLRVGQRVRIERGVLTAL